MLVAKVRVKGDPLHSKLLIFLIITGLVNGMTNIVKELLCAHEELKVGKFGLRLFQALFLFQLILFQRTQSLLQKLHNRVAPNPHLPNPNNFGMFLQISYDRPHMHTGTKEPKRTFPKEPETGTDFQMGRIDTM